MKHSELLGLLRKTDQHDTSPTHVCCFPPQGLKASGPPSSSLPVPAQGPGMSRRGKTRAPSVPEVSREAGLELLRERPEEALSPSRPQVLETPESLSDSLYDSLSSCGSQG